MHFHLTFTWEWCCWENYSAVYLNWFLFKLKSLSSYSLNYRGAFDLHLFYSCTLFFWYIFSLLNNSNLGYITWLSKYTLGCILGKVLALVVFGSKSFCISYQGCAYCWLSQVPRSIPIWCGPQLAWKSFRTAFSQLSQDEDVHSVGCGTNELGDYNELLQCTFFWQFTGYKVSLTSACPCSFGCAIVLVGCSNLLAMLLLGTSLCHRWFS